MSTSTNSPTYYWGSRKFFFGVLFFLFFLERYFLCLLWFTFLFGLVSQDEDQRFDSDISEEMIVLDEYDQAVISQFHSGNPEVNLESFGPELNMFELEEILIRRPIYKTDRLLPDDDDNYNDEWFSQQEEQCLLKTQQLSSTNWLFPPVSLPETHYIFGEETKDILTPELQYRAESYTPEILNSLMSKKLNLSL